MRTCPNCGKSVDDDSVYCGYCDRKLPYQEPPEETGENPEAPAAAPAFWTCGSCGERLEINFDTCWKCGAARAGGQEAPAGTAAPLASVEGADRRVEVYGDKVLLAPLAADPAAAAPYAPPCEIRIGDIVSVEFTNAAEHTPGCIKFNYAAAPEDDPANKVNLSEAVTFGAAVNAEMAGSLELIKERRRLLDEGA